MMVLWRPGHFRAWLLPLKLEGSHIGNLKLNFHCTPMVRDFVPVQLKFDDIRSAFTGSIPPFITFAGDQL
jgi:hypothetical protein